MTVDTQKLRELIAATPKGWGLAATRIDEDSETALIGSECDGEFYPVITVDTGLYDQPDDATALARYYAAVGTPTLSALLDEIDRLRGALASLITGLEEADRNGVLPWWLEGELSNANAALNPPAPPQGEKEYRGNDE